ncbi:TPA: hypothetical protein ACN36B_004377 [Vibrio parahaemolyticus]
MDNIKFIALCFVTVSFLAASVVLRVNGKDGSGWGVMAFIFTIFVAYYI